MALRNIKKQAEVRFTYLVAGLPLTHAALGFCRM